MIKFPSQFGKVELTKEREGHIFKFHPEVRRYRRYFAKVIAEPGIVSQSKLDAMVKILYRPLSRSR